MGLYTLLAETGINVFGQTFDVSLNWIGKLIRWLCTSVGTVGVGIILFSLILKLITLPFDVYQRISMRKQNIQMKENQAKMEKLQKQYANDKDTYNKKVMEMYKENGISVFSSCLPMILSMVIFIVAINAFNAYAQYSNLENYNTMVNAYNAELKSYCVELTEDNYQQAVTVDLDGATNTVTYTVKGSAQDEFIYYKAKTSATEHTDYATVAKAIEYINADPNKAYYVDVERAYAQADIKSYADQAMAKDTTVTKADAVVDYLHDKAQKAVVKAYNDTVKDNASFGWIKNIWATDASYKHPVMSSTDFISGAANEKLEINGKNVKFGKNGTGVTKYTNAYRAETYNIVTGQLTAEKKAANGYYILIVLSIGTILLQQFLMQRTQKEQQKYSSVDGQQASQQKMTMVIMTGMFAIFSFMYSSAFSIYMITSNIFSMLSTLVINKIVDTRVEKKQEVAREAKYKNHATERIEKAKNAGKESAKESKKKK